MIKIGLLTVKDFSGNFKCIAGISLYECHSLKLNDRGGNSQYENTQKRHDNYYLNYPCMLIYVYGLSVKVKNEILIFILRIRYRMVYRLLGVA